jgi:hypothetical protein
LDADRAPQLKRIISGAFVLWTRQQSMQSMLIVWRWLLLISTFVFPQVFGVLLYFRLIRFSRRLGYTLGVLAPAALFFYLAPSFFFAGLREAQLKGVTCGLPALAAAFMVLLGTAAQVFVGLMVQLYLFRKQSGLKSS